jgi:hypothetical protein
VHYSGTLLIQFDISDLKILIFRLFSAQILVELREFGWLKEQKQTEKANNFFFHSFFGAVIYGHGVLKVSHHFSS